MIHKLCTTHPEYRASRYNTASPQSNLFWEFKMASMAIDAEGPDRRLVHFIPSMDGDTMVPVLKALNKNVVHITAEMFEEYLSEGLKGEVSPTGFASMSFGDAPSLLFMEISGEDFDTIIDAYARDEFNALSQAERARRVLG